MNKIEFPRIGADGVLRSRSTIENDYFDSIESEITNNLIDFENRINSGNFKCAKRKVTPYIDEISRLKNDLRRIILSPPKELMKMVNEFQKDLYLEKNDNNKDSPTDFGKEILKAFNYKNFRRNKKLLSLAKWLNIVCCPYCNMHYTLYVLSKDKNKAEARYQFDHFYSKNSYPFLSMSLYNLIPCCPMCNNKKSEIELPIQFNPYYGEIASYFTFEVKNPIPLFIGMRDEIKIDMHWNNNIDNNDKEKFDKMTNLKEQYSCLNDVVEEVFTKAYLEKYYHYSDFFKDIPELSYSLKKRVMHGTYMDPKDINKRPLSKLCQDLWKQANYKEF